MREMKKQMDEMQERLDLHEKVLVKLRKEATSARRTEDTRRQHLQQLYQRVLFTNDPPAANSNNMFPQGTSWSNLKEGEHRQFRAQDNAAGARMHRYEGSEVPSSSSSRSDDNW